METSTPKTRILRHALQTLGNIDTLAEALSARPEDVAAWLEGTASPDNMSFLRALDIVAKGYASAR